MVKELKTVNSSVAKTTIYELDGGSILMKQVNKLVGSVVKITLSKEEWEELKGK